MNIAILIFDGVEELDFQGPWEVLTMVNTVRAFKKIETRDHVFLVSESGGMVTCAKGMRVAADFSHANAPKPDVILVPGGQGTRREGNHPATLKWIADAAPGCTWVTSVCTGSMVLAAAGPARGKRITTHWAAIEEVRKRGEASEVVTGQRWVADGNLVTAAGVSAGIDMAIWLVGQLHGEDMARTVVRMMEYDPAPPYPFDR
ncbi:MAG: DJ-1/PfpI family protein [Rhodospirillaceae bacterium]|nr:DJ-1/PfpI family protein [Rhodospirillaceae bacterium]